MGYVLPSVDFSSQQSADTSSTVFDSGAEPDFLDGQGSPENSFVDSMLGKPKSGPQTLDYGPAVKSSGQFYASSEQAGGSILELLSTDNDSVNGKKFSILGQALGETGLDKVLSTPNTKFTFLAPDDRAFARFANKLGIRLNSSGDAFSSLANALQQKTGSDPKALLSEMLQFHVSEGEQTPSDLNESGKFTSLLSGESIAVKNNPFLGEGGGSPNTIQAKNGIIIPISSVLVPKSLMSVLSADSGQNTVGSMGSHEKAFSLAGNSRSSGVPHNTQYGGCNCSAAAQPKPPSHCGTVTPSQPISTPASTSGGAVSKSYPHAKLPVHTHPHSHTKPPVHTHPHSHTKPPVHTHPHSHTKPPVYKYPSGGAVSKPYPYPHAKPSVHKYPSGGAVSKPHPYPHPKPPVHKYPSGGAVSKPHPYPHPKPPVHKYPSGGAVSKPHPYPHPKPPVYKYPSGGAVSKPHPYPHPKPPVHKYPSGGAVSKPHPYPHPKLPVHKYPSGTTECPPPPPCPSLPSSPATNNGTAGAVGSSAAISITVGFNGAARAEYHVTIMQSQSEMQSAYSAVSQIRGGAPMSAKMAYPSVPSHSAVSDTSSSRPNMRLNFSSPTA